MTCIHTSREKIPSVTFQIRRDFTFKYCQRDNLVRWHQEQMIWFSGFQSPDAKRLFQWYSGIKQYCFFLTVQLYSRKAFCVYDGKFGVTLCSKYTRLPVTVTLNNLNVLGKPSVTYSHNCVQTEIYFLVSQFVTSRECCLG